MIEVLLTLNQDMVERGEHKDKKSQETSTRVKDGVRMHAIQDIIQLGNTVLEHHAHFDPEVVKDTLNVFAQLIDWNDLAHFESIVKSCIQCLSD